MAEDISNKSLVVLLVLAIAVSLVGTMVSIGRISKMGFPVVTARGTTGTVYLNITQDITINVTQTVVNFGNGSVKPTSSNCWLNTTQDTAPVCWNATSYVDPAPFIVRNDGNIQVNFTAQADKTAQTFIGGTAPEFEFNTSNYEVDAASAHAANTEFAAAATEYDAVGYLWPNSTADEVLVHIYVLVPDNAAGAKTATVTFTSKAAI